MRVAGLPPGKRGVNPLASTDRAGKRFPRWPTHGYSIHMKTFLRFAMPLLVAAVFCPRGFAANEWEADKLIAKLTKKLGRIVVPEGKADGETFEERIEYLRVQSRDLDIEADPPMRGVNFVTIGKPKSDRAPSMGLPLKNVPLSELIRGEADYCGMTFVVEPCAVLVHPVGYKLINPVSRQEVVSDLEELSRVVIFPEVSFERATIEEVIEYLRIKGGCCDAEPGALTQVNVILLANRAETGLSLSIDVKNISWNDALRYLAEMAGLKLRFQTHAAVISPVDKALDGQIQIMGKGLAKAQADQIILKTAEFQNVTIRDVIEFVRLKTRDLDPAKEGVSIAVGPGVSLNKTVDLSLKQIPVSELLRYCAELTGHSLSADDRTFVLSAK